MEEKPRVGVLENAPPWWPNWKDPSFSEEDLCEVERYCKKIVENVSKEKGMTPRERWKAAMNLEIPDRPPILTMPYNLAVSRVLDCWSDSLKPGIDMYWYPKLCLKGNLAWIARFNVDFLKLTVFTYGETEWGGSSRAKVMPYTAPAVIDPAAKSPEDWDRIHIPDVYRDGFYPPHLWVIKKTKEFMRKHGVADLMPLIGPFDPDSVDVAAYIIGLKQFFMAIKRNPEVVHKVAELDVPLRIGFAKAVLEAGADFMTCVSFGGFAGLETHKQFDKYYLEVTKGLGASDFAWGFAFDQSQTLEYMCETGSMPFGWMCSHETPLELQRRVATKYKKVFLPLFDPLILVHPDQPKIEAATKNLIKTCAGPGFVVNAGAIDFWTPQENLDFFVKTAKEYGAEVYKGLQK